MIVLGVTGRSQNGKSSAAKAIAKEAASQNLNARVFELSQYVLEDCIAQGRIPAGKTRPELNDEEVGHLVTVGMERRGTDPDHWVKILTCDIEQSKPDVAICPNLRFYNEATAIRNLGGKIIRVISYVVDGVEFISQTRDPNHQSEIEQYFLVADYFLVTKRGEAALLGKQAATLFRYLQDKNDSPR